MLTTAGFLNANRYTLYAKFIMNLLLIDTSTKNLSITVAKDDKVLSFSNAKMTKTLNTAIIPAIDKQLKKNKLKMDDIDCIVIGQGPGAFTSLRVGMATVKGLAFSRGLPLIGVSSLDAVAMNVKGDVTGLCVVSDAKRKLVYAATYDKIDGTLIKQMDYTLCSIDDLLKAVPDDATFIGDGVPLYREAIEKKHMVIEDEELYKPQAKNFLGLIQDRLKAKEYDDIDTLEPLYLYPEDCQVRQ